MTEYDEMQRLTADVDRLLQFPHDDIPLERSNASADYHQLLKVARLLAREDFSADSVPRAVMVHDAIMTAVQPQHTRDRPGFLKRRAWAAGVVMAVIALMVISFPPLRSLAQEIWCYFGRAEDNTMTFEQIDFAYEHFTQRAYFLEPAQAETDFDIREPPLQYFRLEDVSYASTQGEAVDLRYAARYNVTTSQNHYQGIFGLWIKQIYVGAQPVALASMDAIGPDARVEHVWIGGVPGEYVFGGWTTRDPESGTLTWTVDNYHQLRWQQDGILFKMIAVTLPDLTPDITPDQIRDTMITLAESLE